MGRSFRERWLDMPGYRFIRQWGDIDRVFKVGEVISLGIDAVYQVKRRIEERGRDYDLCPYGYYRVPFTFLEEVEMNVTFYRNTEEMLDALTGAMEAADENTQEWQKALKKGDYYRQETEYGFDIFGVVLKNAYKQMNLRNYRFVKAYSEACPEGEMGDLHVSSISEIISKERFEQARENGWQ
jgi:hypothetical protein